MEYSKLNPTDRTKTPKSNIVESHDIPAGSIGDQLGSEEKTVKHVFGKAYDAHFFSISLGGYEKPVTIAIGIPKPKVDRERVDRDYQGSQRLAFHRELVAFRAMLPKLTKMYSGESVAILKGAVVDHDKNALTLAKRVYMNYHGKFVLLREVRQEVTAVFSMESPEGVIR